MRLDGQDNSLLFLHLKSGEDPDDFGLRDQAISQAFSVKRALDRIVGRPANFIVAGYLNTMGIDDPAPYSHVLDLTAGSEIDRIASTAPCRDMSLLDVRGLDGAEQVTALGWALLESEQRDAWLNDYSDHAMLWFEVWEDENL